MITEFRHDGARIVPSCAAQGTGQAPLERPPPRRPPTQAPRTLQLSEPATQAPVARCRASATLLTPMSFLSINMF